MRYNTLSKDLITQLSDQFKVEYNKITGRFVQGDLPVVEAENYFYFRASNDTDRLAVAGGGMSAEMSGDDADFLASVLSFVSLTWHSEDFQLHQLYSSMNDEINKSRPDIVAFFRS